MKWLLITGLLILTACDKGTHTVYVTAPEAPATGYTVTLEVRECDGKLLVDFAGLEIGDGYALKATSATTRKIGHDEWAAVLTFGTANTE